MRATALVIFLMLSGCSLACSMVPGYMAKGLVRLPSGATSSCGAAYKQFVVSFRRHGGWYELYALDPAQAGKVSFVLDAGLAAKGYQLMSNTDYPVQHSHNLSYYNPDSDRYVYVKVISQHQLMSMFINGW